MGIVHHLSALALGPAVKTACDAAGLNLTDGSTEGISGFLAARFKDNSQRLAEALHQANARAWQTLEVALAGDSWWQRVKGLLGPREDQTLAQQVRAFLDATPLPELAGKTKYREACLAELRGARKARLLGGKGPEATAPADLFARFVDPRSLLAAEGDLLDRIALELRQAEYRNLADLLTLQARQGQSLLTVAARYFFRRAVEDDSRLFQGLAFTFLDSLQTDQAQAFAALNLTLNEQGERLQTLLLEVQTVVIETHAAVLDVQEEQRRQGELAGDIYKAVGDLQRRLDLMQPQVRPRDSLSIRTDAERNLVKQVVARYRALPEEQRRGLPALLNAIGILEVAAGDFETAQHDFATVATLTSDTQAKGEAHANAYRAALERRDWNAALRELIEAVKLDGKRFAPFPVGKYHPLRILGAGGFGVAFLCRHKQLDADVVVKTLSDDDLEREVDQVFTEARALWQLDHPAIIRLLDCGYTFPNTKTRPYFVMHYFEGQTLEEHVRAKGPLSVADAIEVARQIMLGLHAAHSKGILHRDVKPANVLVRKEAMRWQVKLIDFGLAMKQHVLQNASTMQRSKTTLASSIAGTLDYAAPEQLGRLPGLGVGPRSDIYAFARTCCYVLFGTPNPNFEHWRRLPEAVAELLSECLSEDPKRRPASSAAVSARLQGLGGLGIATAERKSPQKRECLEEVPGGLEEGRIPQHHRHTPTPLKDRPALPERAVDQPYHDYLVRQVSVWTNTDTLNLKGPFPQHPESLIAECRRLFCQDGFSATGPEQFRKKGILAKMLSLSSYRPFADQLRARYQTCMLALERWAYFYKEHRGDFINLWNQTTSMFDVQPIDSRYFQSQELQAKYQTAG